MDLRRRVDDPSREQRGAELTRKQAAGTKAPSIYQEECMARSKSVTGGIVASIIWLIVAPVGLLFRNSYEAREANALARGSCRGEEEFQACVDAYYASVGGAPEIDWTRIGLVLIGGLVLIWVIVYLLKSARGDKPAD